MADIFISYRRRPSGSLALLIQEKLKNRHRINAYVDTTRTDSTRVQFPDRLMQAIADAPIFVCLLADDTLESEWVRKEIQRAYELRKFCIPVFQAERYVPPNTTDVAIDYLLNHDGVQVFDIKNVFIDEAINQIAALARPRKPSRLKWIPISFALLAIVTVLGLLAANRPQGPSTASPTLNSSGVALVNQDATPTETVTITLSHTPTNTVAATASLTLSVTNMATMMASGTPTGTVTSTTTATQTKTASQTPTNIATLIATNTATPTRTASPTRKSTMTPTSTFTQRPRATATPNHTSEITRIAKATVNVQSANLRQGPGTNYPISGSTVLDDVFNIIARTDDSEWYLIQISVNRYAWIWSGTVETSISNSEINIASTIPAPPTSGSGETVLQGSNLPRTFSGNVVGTDTEWDRDNHSIVAQGIVTFRMTILSGTSGCALHWGPIVDGNMLHFDNSSSTPQTYVHQATLPRLETYTVTVYTVQRCTFEYSLTVE